MGNAPYLVVPSVTFEKQEKEYELATMSPDGLRFFSE